MRLLKRGQKGFTLIELLIVVAILGVLAAVVIPNVTRFVGAGEEEAAETELHNIQLAVTSMMLENGITSIPNPLSDPVSQSTNQMGLQDDGVGGWDDGFPDFASAVETDDKRNDPDGVAYLSADQDGYVLFGHDKSSGSSEGLVNYVTVAVTTYYYTAQADGTVQQWDINGDPLVWD